MLMHCFYQLYQIVSILNFVFFCLEKNLDMVTFTTIMCSEFGTDVSTLNVNWSILNICSLTLIVSAIKQIKLKNKLFSLCWHTIQNTNTLVHNKRRQTYLPVIYKTHHWASLSKQTVVRS